MFSYTRFTLFGLFISSLINLWLFCHFLNSTIGLPYVLKFLHQFWTNRIPGLALKSVEPSLLTEYNGLVLVFSFYLLIYFIVKMLWLAYHVKFNWAVFSKLRSFSEKKKVELIYDYLEIFLRYGMITIFLFTLLFYSNYHLSLEFADKAISIYLEFYDDFPTISKKWSGYYVDYYVCGVAWIGKMGLTYFKPFYLVNELKLVQFKFNVKAFKWRKNYGNQKFLKHVIVLIIMISLTQNITLFIVKTLTLASLRKDYIYTLHDLIALNNNIHYCLLVSILLIVICDNLIQWIKEYVSTTNDYSARFYLKHENLTISLAFLKLINSLSYYLLFLSSLVLFTKSIPSGFIAIGYKLWL